MRKELGKEEGCFLTAGFGLIKVLVQEEGCLLTECFRFKET